MNLLKRWGPAAIIMAIIFWASATPSTDIPKFGLWDTLVKKGGHALGYGLLALAYQYGLANGQRPSLRQAALSVVLAVLYAVTDEFHQSFTKGRTPTWLDVVIDGAGASAATGLRLWWQSRGASPLKR
jgi:VanZ family protein